MKVTYGGDIGDDLGGRNSWADSADDGCDAADNRGNSACDECGGSSDDWCH